MKLRWLRGCTSVDLSDNNIDDTCTQPLKNLLALRQLHCLNLRGNDLGPSAAKALLESLPRCKGLQVLRLEANALFSRAAGAGAHLAAALRAAVKAGGCRHLWRLSVTLDDFDSSFFVNAPRNAEKAGRLAVATGHATTRGSAGTTPSRQTPAHPMNALAFSRAFHPRAPGGGAGAVLNGDGTGKAPSGRGLEPNNKVATGAGRGAITSLGLPFARLHPRTIEGLATYAVSSLTHLDLSYCQIGVAGAVALARTLDGGGGNDSKDGALRGRGSRSLRSLKLPHNFVGDSGACALGRALSNNRCLTYLSLASNGIGCVGGRALATALGSRGKVVGGDGDGGGDGGGGGGGGGGGDGGGGSGGSGLARLDVGDNPLGEKAVQLLVDAASAKGGDGDGSGAATEVQVLGLDLVAGATVATRAAAPAVDSAGEGFGLDSDGVVLPATSTALLAVHEGVPVKPEDASDDDGLVEVYHVLLDSRFEPPPGQPGGSAGARGGCSTLDIQWSFSAEPSYLEVCEWRVSRLRHGESEFKVKEGIGTEGLAGWQANSDDTEVRDGYSRVRLQCNGWNKGDVLKIFVRPGAGGRTSCCDLVIGLAGKGPPSAASPSYGLLWADPAIVDVGVESASSWREEDCPRSPSVAERARVALLMSSNNEIHRRSPLTADGGNPDGGGDGRAHTMHRLRQVHVAHGGRIRTSWHTVLAAAPTRPSGRAATGYGSNGSGGTSGMAGDGHRSVCGYSWALVRTRGVMGDESCHLACRVVEQGSASDCSAGSRCTGDQRGAIGPSEEEEYDNRDGVDLSIKGASSKMSSSPWRWHRFDVDTTGWLPGDLLSLWIRLDELWPSPPSPLAAAGGDRVGWTSAAEATSGRGGQSRRGIPGRYHPLVRCFELRAVDDARAEEIARGCYAPLSRGRHQRPPAGRNATRLDGMARLEGECFYGPACSAAAFGYGTSVAAVQLDFAAVSPMNLAAAGGSWA
eukprot:g13717.t1